MAKSILVFMMIILVLNVLKSALAVSSLSHADECSLLLQFKESMSIKNYSSYDSRAYPKVASWNLNGSDGASNCCLWDGVKCTFGHVIGLDLSSSFLSGPISSNNSLFNLIHLRTLNLADNHFNFSQIPSGIGRLSQLANLNLSNSYFSGEVPKQISQLRNLVSLDLSQNRLTLQGSDFRNLVQNTSGTLRELFLSEVNIDSELPNSLVNCSLLTSLVMRYCGLRGEFPAAIFDLQNLQILDVDYNYNLTGYIPEVHGNSELKHLSVAHTKFRGSIPASIGNLTHLNILDLSSCAFKGTVPASIGNLTHLNILDLSWCAFKGTVPASIGNLTHLNILDLSKCAFTGTLPASVSNLTHLNILSLSENSFDKWKLPDWFGKLNKITYLDLSDVNLYGEIPSSFFNLTQVEKLYLFNNQLKGQLPSSLVNLQNVEEFYLDDNNVTVDFYLFLSLKKLKYLYLSGNNITLSVIDSHTNKTQPQFIVLELVSCNLKVFPEFLRFQHQLEYLNLENNNIEGLIPGWMWNVSKETLGGLLLTKNLLTGFEQHSPVVYWVSLWTLDLRHNMLHGSIPMPPPTIRYFYASNNKLWGDIPRSICDLLSLELLDLSFNNITGSIPPCLEKLLNSLVVLNLRSNTLQGTIPNIFTNGSKLEMVDLSENKLEGQIPRSLENCESLDILDLRRNILQGTIPNMFTNGSKLQMIDLSENKLEGRLPRSLENCESLQILDLGDNFIEDMFPFWLGALSELQVLILRFNKFHGTIRIPSKIKVNFPKLHIIDLSYNSFSGDLPHQYFQEWSAMKDTEVDGTYMETIIMSYYWFSIQMTNKGVKKEYVKIINTFFAIDLSSNMFTGKIPNSIRTLGALKSLNLSNNELCGVIPPSMGNLINLESLDLSSNKLSGMIPQDLVQLNFLEVLNVSNNNLTGPIPQGRHFDTFLNDSYLGNQALCGFPLSIKCGDSEASNSPEVSLEEDTESDFPNGIDWVVILIGVLSGLVIGLVCGDYLTTRYYKWFLQRFRK